MYIWCERERRAKKPWLCLEIIKHKPVDLKPWEIWCVGNSHSDAGACVGRFGWLGSKRERLSSPDQKWELMRQKPGGVGGSTPGLVQSVHQNKPLKHEDHLENSEANWVGYFLRVDDIRSPSRAVADCKFLGRDEPRKLARVQGPEWLAHTGNSRAGEADLQRSLGLTDQSVYLNGWVPGQRVMWSNAQDCAFTSTCTRTCHMNLYSHIALIHMPHLHMLRKGTKDVKHACVCMHTYTLQVFFLKWYFMKNYLF